MPKLSRFFAEQSGCRKSRKKPDNSCLHVQRPCKRGVCVRALDTYSSSYRSKVTLSDQLSAMRRTPKRRSIYTKPSKRLSSWGQRSGNSTRTRLPTRRPDCFRQATVTHSHANIDRRKIILVLSPVHTSNNVEATWSNATSRTILSTKSKQIEYVQFVSTLSKGNKFYDKLVRHCCRFGKKSRMLLRQSRTLLRHWCWCGRGFATTVLYKSVSG